MLKTRKSVLITGAVLCVASLIFCKIWFAPIKYSFLFILLFVLLYLDFFWFTKDYNSASDMMRRPSSEEKVKYMSDMAFALKSILVLFLFMFAVCILLVPMVMYQSGLMEVKITPIASLVLGHLSIYLTQYAYEIGGTKCS